MNLCIYFYVKSDRLEFRLNVKEFWILFATREKAKYFHVTENYKGVKRTLIYLHSPLLKVDLIQNKSQIQTCGGNSG